MIQISSGNAWQIHDNLFKNQGHDGINLYCVVSGATVTYNIIKNNEFTSPDVDYSRAFESQGDAVGKCSHNQFLYNYVHKIYCRIQVLGDHNTFAYNIIDTMSEKRAGSAWHGSNTTEANGFSIASFLYSDSNTVANNVVMNTDDAGINVSTTSGHNFIFNNIVCNTGKNPEVNHLYLANTALWITPTAVLQEYRDNIFYNPGVSAIILDHSYAIGTQITVAAFNTATTDSAAGNLQTDPMLVANSDYKGYRLRAGSPAIDVGRTVGITPDYYGTTIPQGSATDIGVNEFIPVTDNIRPASITTLAADSAGANVMYLRWTAVGNDSLTGLASNYDLRYSTSLITSGNFGSATIVSMTILPDSVDKVQRWTVTGIVDQTPYYFAIKTWDGTNWSAISNVFLDTTTTITFNPKSIDSLKFWVESRQLIGLSNNDSVATWYDSSTSAVNAVYVTQSNLAKKPVYKTNIFGTKPALYFNRTDSLCMSADSIAGRYLTGNKIPHTIIVVAKGASVNTAIGSIIGLGRSTTSTPLQEDGFGSSVVKYFIQRRDDAATLTGGNITEATGDSTTQAVVYAFRFTGDSLRVYRNAVTRASDDGYGATTLGVTTLNRLTIGAERRNSSIEDVADVYVAAVLVYNRSLTAAEISSLTTQLKTIYTIP